MRDDAELELALREIRADRFESGFANRVMQRTRGLQQRSLASMLQRYFIWMVPAAVTAIALLAIHNAHATTTQRRGIDALLALPAVTLDAAYALESGANAP